MLTQDPDNIIVTVQRFVDGKPHVATKVLSLTEIQHSNFTLVSVTAQKLYDSLFPNRRLFRDHGGKCSCGNPDDPKFWHRPLAHGGCYAPFPLPGEKR